MQKTKIRSPEAYVKFLVEQPFFRSRCVEDIERFAGIAFAYVTDGKVIYPAADDFPEEDEPLVDDAKVDFSQFKLARRGNDDYCWPEQFPCLVVSLLEDGHDRAGKFGIAAVEFVYPSDVDFLLHKVEIKEHGKV